MKKIYLLLLLAIAVMSCSKDEVTSNQKTVAIQQTSKITFTLYSQQPLSNVKLTIKDIAGNVLKTKEYLQVKDISYEITSGSQLIISTLDEGYFLYVWKFFDASGNNIYEQVVTGNMIFEVTKNYTL